jgi:hypothetical protein
LKERRNEGKKVRKKEGKKVGNEPLAGGFSAKPFGRQAGCLFLKSVFTFPGFDPITIK